MMTPVSIDSFIANFDVRERHQIMVRAPAAFVFQTALEFDMRSLPMVRALFWLRGKILGAQAEGSRPRRGLLADMVALGWRVLGEEPGRIVIAGTACQPWEANVVFTSIVPEQFAGFSMPDQVKIAWTLETEACRADLTRFATETRAVATDDQARAKFKRYWGFFRLGIVAIRWLLLRAVRREAERRWKPMPVR
jgi:hypothetical protein